MSTSSMLPSPTPAHAAVTPASLPAGGTTPPGHPKSLLPTPPNSGSGRRPTRKGGRGKMQKTEAERNPETGGAALKRKRNDPEPTAGPTKRRRCSKACETCRAKKVACNHPLEATSPTAPRAPTMPPTTMGTLLNFLVLDDDGQGAVLALLSMRHGRDVITGTWP